MNPEGDTLLATAHKTSLLNLFDSAGGVLKNTMKGLAALHLTLRGELNLIHTKGYPYGLDTVAVAKSGLTSASGFRGLLSSTKYRPQP